MKGSNFQITKPLLVLARLFAKVPRPGDSEGTFRSSSQADTCYYQFNHSKVEAIPLNPLPKDTSELDSVLSALSL